MKNQTHRPESPYLLHVSLKNIDTRKSMEELHKLLMDLEKAEGLHPAINHSMGSALDPKNPRIRTAFNFTVGLDMPSYIRDEIKLLKNSSLDQKEKNAQINALRILFVEAGASRIASHMAHKAGWNFVDAYASPDNIDHRQAQIALYRAPA